VKHHLIKKRLASARAQFLETRNALARARAHLSCAKADVTHYERREAALTDQLAADTQVVGSLWLDLMNSMSHRRFLKFVLEHS